MVKRRKCEAIFMIKSSKLKGVLEFIKETDNKKVSFLKKEIYDKFPETEIESVVDVLLERGILRGFQGSTKELVVDDYDALYRIINKPIDYTME